MQTDQTRLVIHTGDVPKSSAGDRQTGRVRSRRKTDADRAGSVVIMGADESFAGKTARDRHRDHAKRAQGRLRPEASGHSGAARSGDAARLPKAPAACADGKNSVMPQRIGRTRLFAKRPPHCDAALRRAEQSGATLGAQNAADPEARSNARGGRGPGRADAIARNPALWKAARNRAQGQSAAFDVRRAPVTQRSTVRAAAGAAGGEKHRHALDARGGGRRRTGADHAH